MVFRWLLSLGIVWFRRMIRLINIRHYVDATQVCKYAEKKKKNSSLLSHAWLNQTPSSVYSRLTV